MTSQYVIPPDRPFRLADFRPDDTRGVDRAAAEKQMEQDIDALNDLKELLYVSGANAVLVVLQGTDTSGKDGLIRHLSRGITPLGSNVAAFKVPSEEEAGHDYLWRIHRQVPPRGHLTIFNRSHYESVVVEGIKGIVGWDRVEERYEEINQFERMLTREGVIILKFFLHISKAEQEERLNERIAEPEKNWKVSPGDWQDRERWDEFQGAYEKMIQRTSTERAPWTVVPSDRKWYRSYLVARRMVEALEPWRDEWHTALRARGDTQMAALRAWRESRKGNAE